MKIKLRITIGVAIVCLLQNVNAQSNKSLSNLTAPTAVNQSLLPDKNNSKDLGSDSSAWKNIYFTNRLYLNKKIVLHTPGTANFFVGQEAGKTSLSGSFNTGAGQYTLGNITSGLYNTATGYTALYHLTSGRDNTGSGYLSLYFDSTGSYNTATGTWTLYNNTIGNNNTALGYSALWQNKAGNDNTAIGKYAMYSNDKGYSNVAIGTMSLFKSVRNNNTVAIGDSTLYNFTGDLFNYESYTTAVGSKALFSVTTGYENTAIGTRALYNTTKGAINTAIGVSAMFQNTEGVFNTAMGVSALSDNTTGDYNTGIGYSSLHINKTGNQNTAVGAYAGPNSFDLVSNSTSIGYLARATTSNQVWLGNTDVTSIGGQVGWTTFSDGRYKKNIKENVAGLSFINSLRPITYTVDINRLKAYHSKGINEKDNHHTSASAYSNEQADKIIYDGFVAQEVEAAAKKSGFVFSGVDKPKDENGLYGLRYDNFVVPLVKAVQELSKQNDSLQKQNNNLEKRIEKLEAMMSGSSSNTAQVSKNIFLSDAMLEQNVPNPFSNTTTIRYTLSQKFTAASILITNNLGKTIKQFNISNTKGSINIDAATLAAGVYNYTLIIDGRLSDTKQMIIKR